MNVITKCGKHILQNGAAFFYYKVRQTVLQSGAALLLQSGAGSITKWSRYCKVGQVLLQSGAGITKWGIITKWCITVLLLVFKISFFLFLKTLVTSYLPSEKNLGVVKCHHETRRIYISQISST